VFVVPWWFNIGDYEPPRHDRHNEVRIRDLKIVAKLPAKIQEFARNRRLRAAKGSTEPIFVARQTSNRWDGSHGPIFRFQNPSFTVERRVNFVFTC
jgi:hypothetical protein